MTEALRWDVEEMLDHTSASWPFGGQVGNWKYRIYGTHHARVFIRGSRLVVLVPTRRTGAK